MVGLTSGTDLLASKPGAEAPALDLLTKLRSLPSVGPLYDDMLKNAKGLVFLSTWKAGVIYVGGQMGAGFVVSHLPDGNWSAPVFINWHGLAGGITFGVSKANTLIVLNSERAMAQYRSQEIDFKFGGGLSVDYIKPNDPGTGIDGGELKAKMSTGDRDAFVFNVDTKGLLFDLTLNGGVTNSDSSTNAKVYPGFPGITPDRILAGEVPQPPVAAPLYAVLGSSQAGASAPVAPAATA